MRRTPKPGFWLVARRECRWLLHDHAALILIFGVPLFAFVVLTAVFSHPVIRGLGVVVVDADRSDTSRAFVEQVAASPGLSIVERAGDLASAVRAIRSGEAIGAVYVPADFERDLKAEQRPQVVAFYNQQFLTAAGVASSGLSDSLAAAAKQAAARAAPKSARIGALVAETIVLVNPQKNYAQFLLRALLPVIIHVIIALAAGYAVGSEFRRRSMRDWLASAGGNPIVALTGKLAPLFAIFFVMMLSVVLILEGLLKISFKGDVPMIVAAGSLLIVAYLALGALLQLLVRDLATGLGLTGIVVSPAFGYAGVGFPVLGMNAFASAWGALLPVRWYMAVLLGQAARGLPLHESARPFAALAALAVLYSLLALLRLRALARSAAADAPAAERPPAPAAAPHGIGGAFAAEWRRVLALRGAFILLVLAPIVYGFYYPQPYLNQILRKIPIVVVDNDLSELSRRIVQTLDASGAVNVAFRADTLVDARAALDRGDAFAVVGIPPGTERDVLKGTTVHVPIYADATYTFIFRTTGSGIAVAINTFSSELAAGGARTDGSLVKATLAIREPGRHPAAADLQSGWRLCQLHRAGSFRADPATDAADRRVAPDGRHARSTRRWCVRHRARPRRRPPDHLSAGARALLRRIAALLRLFHARPAAATVRARIRVHAGDQLHGPGGRRLVQASGNTNAHFSRHQPAAAVPDRFFVAARSDSGAGAARRLHLPLLFRDRRARAHRPAGRESVGGGARLAGAVASGGHLFHARGDVRVLREAEAGAWLRGR
jgi:ABC-2 type transport system permease protein